MQTEADRESDKWPAPGRGTILRDRISRQLRWRLRRLRPAFKRPIDAWRHAAVDSADGILASYPRSGSRWLEMMLGELLVGHEIDVTTTPYPLAFISDLRKRPDAPRPLPDGGRMIKTHDRYRREYRRGVYVVRHPGDVAISYFNFVTRWALPRIGFDRWFAAWIRGEIDGYGTWQANVESWLDAPVPIQLIRFEDLKPHTVPILDAALRTLGIERDIGDIQRAVENNSVDRMKAKLERGERTSVIGRLPLPAEHIHYARGGSAVWRDLLTAGQRELLRRHAGRAMERCGYDVSQLEEPELAKSG